MLAVITCRARGLGSASAFTFVTNVFEQKMNGSRITEAWSNKPVAKAL
jgi:hypothetical protein